MRHLEALNAKIARLEGALAEAKISLGAIGHPQPHDPPDAHICGIIARGALVRIQNRLGPETQPEGEWQTIDAAPKDGSRQWVKRVHQGRKIAEGWAVWNTNGSDSPMRHSDENGPADIDYANTPRWLTDDRRYSFPTPTHWRPSKK